MSLRLEPILHASVAAKAELAGKASISGSAIRCARPLTAEGANQSRRSDSCIGFARLVAR
ncbi:hypothetical protein OSW16_21410 [Pseudomonas putida]|nr:hypothetical protein OSW16_21410 [Pseudomonas putida]